MDPNSFAATADTPSSATDPLSALFPTGGEANQAGEATQQSYQPADASVPGDAGAPLDTSTPGSTPEIDRTAYEAAVAKAQQYDQIAPQYQQYAQAMDELRQLAAHAQRTQQEQAARQQAQSERDQIYHLAQNMPPDQAMAYIRRNEDQVVARYEARVREAQEQGQRQTMQVAEQLAAPIYAQDLVKRNGLPPEYTQLIAHLPPREMESQMPLLRKQFENTQNIQQQLQAALKQIDQYSRSQQAQAINATGAHTVGGVGSPAVQNGQQPRDGSTEHLLSIPGMAQLFGVR